MRAEIKTASFWELAPPLTGGALSTLDLVSG